MTGLTGKLYGEVLRMNNVDGKLLNDIKSYQFNYCKNKGKWE